MNTIKDEPNPLVADLAAKQIEHYENGIVQARQVVSNAQAQIAAYEVMRDHFIAVRDANTPAVSTGHSAQKTMLPEENGKKSGISASVKEALRSNPSGLSLDAVIERMRASGTDKLYTGATPFRVRIGNELYRLTKAKVLRKRGDIYTVTDELLN